LAFSATALLAPPGADNNPFLLGLILSTISLGVVVPVLKERELTGTPFGQYIMVASSSSDKISWRSILLSGCGTAENRWLWSAQMRSV
jgi:Kef-type K+ transport system membrane component KefB